MRNKSTATRVTVSAMSSALGILCLFAASVLPTVRLALLFMSSLCVWIPLNERGGLFYALLTYAVTALAAFLIIPDKLYPTAYVLFFGCYGMIKLGLDRLISDKFVALAVKLIVCDLLLAAALLLMTWIMDINIFTMLPELPVWILLAAAQAAFIAYEIVFSLCAHVFDTRLRSVIIPKR